MCPRLHRLFYIFGILAVVTLYGCKQEQSSTTNWNSSSSNGIQTELYFGGTFRDPTAWPTFLRDVVSPRFLGFTVISAEGNWKDRVGLPTRILRIVHTQNDSDRIEEIRKLFIEKFHHQSVMRVSIPVMYEF